MEKLKDKQVKRKSKYRSKDLVRTTKKGKFFPKVTQLSGQRNFTQLKKFLMIHHQPNKQTVYRRNIIKPFPKK